MFESAKITAHSKPLSMTQKVGGVKYLKYNHVVKHCHLIVH